MLAGGTLSDRKGVNVPDTLVPVKAMTKKDHADLSFAVQQGADWIGLSFVQRPEDLVEARGLIGDRAGLLAKIEKPQAIDVLGEIIELCDAVMVALTGFTDAIGRARELATQAASGTLNCRSGLL